MVAKVSLYGRFKFRLLLSRGYAGRPRYHILTMDSVTGRTYHEDVLKTILHRMIGEDAMEVLNLLEQIN